MLVTPDLLASLNVGGVHASLNASGGTVQAGLNVNAGGVALSAAINNFQAQNLSPTDIFRLSGSLPQSVGGISTPTGNPSLDWNSIPQAKPATQSSTPVSTAVGSLEPDPGEVGSWEAVHYADDLNYHHPKFKFLFKVMFKGFPGGPFYYFVQRCDRPKVRLQHQDVNYYNFRTRVLTSVIYEPLTITFLDEIGNSVNDFIKSYMALKSGTGAGNYGIEQGWGNASSTIPYARGYAEGQEIVVEQVFVNPAAGALANRFTFLNPRIETIDFDEMSMEENAGSMVSISFSYDAISFDTVEQSTLYSWGNTDLLRGGGTSGPENAGDTSGVGSGDSVSLGSEAAYVALQQGSDLLNAVPTALSGLYSPVPVGPGTSLLQLGGQASSISSGGDVLTSAVQGTLRAIVSGQNLLTGGISVGGVRLGVSIPIPPVPPVVYQASNLLLNGGSLGIGTSLSVPGGNVGTRINIPPLLR